MSFLSDILNPEPAGEGHVSRATVSPSDVRRESVSQMAPPEEEHLPQVYPSFNDPGYEVAPTTTARDAAQALATFSKSDAPPPTQWNRNSNSASISPTQTHATVRRTSSARTGSIFSGENAAPIELPQLPEVARKMSSPTLDQYHVASRSPEQIRRSSLIVDPDRAFTLAPIQSQGSRGTSQKQAAEEPPLGQDTSVLVQNEETEGKEQDLVSQVQHVADNRKPDCVRQEATTTQIRRPSDAGLDQSPSQQRSLVPGSASQPESLLSSETPARLDLPPTLDTDTPKSDSGKPQSRRPSRAHSPLTMFKQEHSTHTNSPLRESSVPVPSTEPQVPTPSVPRKRPPPKSAAKKGTASSVKKEPPTKKRKTDSGPTAAKRSNTPSSQRPKGALANAKRLASSSATPANSSPAPRSVRTASTPARSIASHDPEADNRSQVSEDEEDEEDEGTPDPDADLYCLCRRPDTGTFMIGCDGGCDDWFHGKCVGIAERDKGLIDHYVCPRCTETGLGPTTWKRMCRRHGCRMPARTPKPATAKKSKKEEAASKYCSTACGVQYFKDMVTQTRESSEASPRKPRGKKNPISALSLPDTNDLGPLGGSVNLSELAAITTTNDRGIDEFKRLGEGMLSPPATPASKSTTADSSTLTQQIPRLSATEQENITDLTAKKDTTRARHALLKDRLKFITLLKQSATTLAESRGLKPKEFCGFDDRITWTEDEFAVWRVVPEVVDALRAGRMPRTSSSPLLTSDANTAAAANRETNRNETEAQDEGREAGLCTKKRCTRHNDWAKLALDDTRFEMSENSEVMRGLDRAEKDVLQRASLRARALAAGGVEGVVEMHPESEDEEDVGGAGGETDVNLDVERVRGLVGSAEDVDMLDASSHGDAADTGDAVGVTPPEDSTVPTDDQQEERGDTLGVEDVTKTLDTTPLVMADGIEGRHLESLDELIEGAAAAAAAASADS